jgi:hypothetical protein
VFDPTGVLAVGLGRMLAPPGLRVRRRGPVEIEIATDLRRRLQLLTLHDHRNPLN